MGSSQKLQKRDAAPPARSPEVHDVSPSISQRSRQAPEPCLFTLLVPLVYARQAPSRTRPWSSQRRETKPRPMVRCSESAGEVAIATVPSSASHSELREDGTGAHTLPGGSRRLLGEEKTPDLIFPHRAEGSGGRGWVRCCRQGRSPGKCRMVRARGRIQSTGAERLGAGGKRTQRKPGRGRLAGSRCQPTCPGART